MSKKKAVISKKKVAELKAKKQAEKAEQESTDSEISINFESLTVDGWKLGDPLPYKYAIPEVEQESADVVPMFWDDTPPPLVSQTLFPESDEDKLTEDWTGWASSHFVTQHFFFNDFGYFKQQIQTGRFNGDIGVAKNFAIKVLTMVNDIYQGAISGDVFHNSMMRLLGMEEKQLQAVHGMEFFKMIELAWKVGHAQSVQKTKAAIQSKAEDGDLEAQKTLLKYEGILSAENAPSSGGDIIFNLDSEDMKA